MEIEKSLDEFDIKIGEIKNIAENIKLKANNLEQITKKISDLIIRMNLSIIQIGIREGDSIKEIENKMAKIHESLGV